MPMLCFIIFFLDIVIGCIAQWNLSIRDTLGPFIWSLLQRCPQFRGHLIHYVQYHTGTQNGVLIIEVSVIQRFVIEGFHCIVKFCCKLLTVIHNN